MNRLNIKFTYRSLALSGIISSLSTEIISRRDTSRTTAERTTLHIFQTAYDSCQYAWSFMNTVDPCVYYTTRMQQIESMPFPLSKLARAYVDWNASVFLNNFIPSVKKYMEDFPNLSSVEISEIAFEMNEVFQRV